MERGIRREKLPRGEIFLCSHDMFEKNLEIVFEFLEAAFHCILYVREVYPACKRAFSLHVIDDP